VETQRKEESHFRLGTVKAKADQSPADPSRKGRGPLGDLNAAPISVQLPSTSQLPLDLRPVEVNRAKCVANEAQGGSSGPLAFNPLLTQGIKILQALGFLQRR